MRGNVVYIAVAAIFAITAAYAQSSAAFVFLALYVLFLFVRKRRLFFISVITACFFYPYFTYVDQHNKTRLSSAMTEFLFRLATPVAVDGDRLQAVVNVDGEKLQLVYYIKSQEEKQALALHLAPGAVCKVKGTLKRPALPRNPNAFDYRRYLRFHHIHWILTPQSISLQDCHPSSLTIYERLLSLREKGIRQIATHFPAESIGIVQALLYGERAQLDEPLLEGYQKLGLIHLLAISGLHVTLLVGALFSLLIRFWTKEAATMMMLIFLPVYIVLTGASPSVIRACLTAMLFLAANYGKATLPPLDGLSIAFVIMLIADPYMLWDVGFQLSFAVTFALILSSPFIMSHHSPLWRLFFTTFIAQLSALPFLIYYFFEISLWSMVLNMIFVPLYSFLLPLSFISVAACAIHPLLSAPFIWLLQKVIVLSSKAVLFFSSAFPLSLVLGRPSFWLIIAYTAAICAAFVQMEKRCYWGIGWVVAVITFHALSPYVDRYGEVVFLDVGQGDCIYIELPYRQAVYLIDTGGTLPQQKEPWQQRNRNWDVGKNVVIPFLKSNGVRTIDKLIATHEDVDHIGAAEEIVRGFTVKQLLVSNGMKKNSVIYEQLMQIARQSQVSVREIARGSRWSKAGISFYVLHPSTAHPDDNNNSVVLYTKIGGLSWLFTGDLEEAGEKELIGAFPRLKADVLKVAHHGSATSTTELFLDKIQPKIAVISVGEHNRYHHPSPSVIERLQKRNTLILRTDQHGAVRFTYVKNHGTFSVMLP
ncbi:DNA internalization-related competence protein ComEC/Rec2 [Saccharococcus thermophilus]|uniref:Competence protein ComEC n=1 Tax=Saccharococcus thermophilus TaxID=29396 RepID=A0A846MGZ9_9BACL|nr:DNA internalization-related competence protein ComEC/Rec2 [Saccharococcus thermophilus]NIK15483.1 competence protein ComEC [Saccharococcus thermophilus]